MLPFSAEVQGGGGVRSTTRIEQLIAAGASRVVAGTRALADHGWIVKEAARFPGRSAGIATPNTFFGGSIKGITRNLDYIAGLGCTAIWLSPVRGLIRS